jgi:DNA ligase (NAD+)
MYAFALVEAEDTGTVPASEGEDRGTVPASEDSEDRGTVPVSWTSRLEQMEFLKTLGFETVGYEAVTAADLEEAIDRFSKEAASSGFDIPVDGLVLEYDDIEYSESLGATAKFPRDAMAFKWQDEEAETELLEIEWSASRTGLINPIAVFEPVELEGTTVSRASVHNVSILEDLALGRGDRIRVYKANMIIPQISENLTRSGTEQPPDACPVCGATTEIKDAEGVKTLYCTNEDCPARKIKAFAHFVSRGCMNIEGLSEQTLEKFIAAGLLHELADIFRLAVHRDTIVMMEGFGKKSYDNLIASIERARATTADRLLAGLGVPEVGTATAKMIARSFGNDWGRIAAADADALSKIAGVGAVIASLYTNWFADSKNKAMTAAVVSEVRLAADPPARSATAVGADSTAASPIAGLTFVITGSLEGYKSRDLLAEKIESHGGRVAGSVSSKTDYLINNDAASQSTKNKGARALGVAIITEAEFEALVNQTPNKTDPQNKQETVEEPDCTATKTDQLNKQEEVTEEPDPEEKK